MNAVYNFRWKQGSYFNRRLHVWAKTGLAWNFTDHWFQMHVKESRDAADILVDLNCQNGGIGTMRTNPNSDLFLGRWVNGVWTPWLLNDARGEPINEPAGIIGLYAGADITKALSFDKAVYDLYAYPYILEQSQTLSVANGDFTSIAIAQNTLTATAASDPFSNVKAGDRILLSNCEDAENDGINWVASVDHDAKQITLARDMIVSQGWGRKYEVNSDDENIVITVYGRPVEIDYQTLSSDTTFTVKKTDTGEGDRSSIECADAIFTPGDYDFVDEHGVNQTGNRIYKDDVIVIGGTGTQYTSRAGQIGGANPRHVYTVHSVTATKIVLNEKLTLKDDAGSADLVGVTWPVIKRVDGASRQRLLKGTIYLEKGVTTA